MAEKKSTIIVTLVDGVSTGLNKIKQGFTLFNAFMVGTVFVGIKKVMGAFSEQERGLAQLEAVLSSTGNAIGMTANEISNMTNKLRDQTAIDDEIIQAGVNMLLTFTKIGKEALPEASEAILDMATAMNNGLTPTMEQLQTVAKQVGKAMNDPVQGILSLRKAGVTFSTQQKEQIANFIKHNDLISAQKIVLQELAKEFGGSAKAQADNFQGSMNKLANTVEDVQESIGGKLAPGISLLADGFRGAIDKIKPFLKMLGGLPALVVGAIASLGALGIAISVFGKTITTSFWGVPAVLGAVISLIFSLSSVVAQFFKKVGAETDEALKARLKNIKEEYDNLSAYSENYNNRIKDFNKKNHQFTIELDTKANAKLLSLKKQRMAIEEVLSKRQALADSQAKAKKLALAEEEARKKAEAEQKATALAKELAQKRIDDQQKYFDNEMLKIDYSTKIKKASIDKELEMYQQLSKDKSLTASQQITVQEKIDSIIKASNASQNEAELKQLQLQKEIADKRVKIDEEAIQIIEALDGQALKDKEKQSEQLLAKFQADFDAKKQYQIFSLDDQKRSLEAEIRNVELANDEKAKLEKELADVNVQIANQTSEAIVNQTLADIGSMMGLGKLAQQEFLNFTSYIADGVNSKNKDIVSVAKAMAIFNIGVKSVEASMSAYASLAGIPFIGPALGAVAGATALALGAEKVAEVTAMEPKMAQGGASYPVEGGKRVVFAEGKNPEAIIPLDNPDIARKIQKAVGVSGDNPSIKIQKDGGVSGNNSNIPSTIKVNVILDNKVFGRAVVDIINKERAGLL